MHNYDEQDIDMTAILLRHGSVAVSTLASHVILGVQIWLSTLETVYLSWLDIHVNVALYAVGYQPADDLGRDLRFWIWIRRQLTVDWYLLRLE